MIDESGPSQNLCEPEWRQIVEEKILPEALRDVDLGPDVIEIGPGPGFTSIEIRKYEPGWVCSAVCR